MNDIITVKELSFTYPKEQLPALEGISLTIHEGEFVTLCGASGCGKSTLLRMLKPFLQPHGTQSGDILFFGEPLSGLSERDAAQSIALVQQHPDAGIVTDRVWHELAFSLESVGTPPEQLRRRVAECAEYFGLSSLFEKDTADLSGGEKQLLALASAAALRPRLLLLDEPTSQLDPIAARELFDTAFRLCRDFGITVLVAEHRLEELFPISDRVLVLDEGRLIADCPPRALSLPENHPMSRALPAAARIYALSGGEGLSVLTVREGRQNEQVRAYLKANAPANRAYQKPEGKPVLSARELFAAYGRGQPEVLKGASIELFKGEVFALLGGNGSGKSTLLKALFGAVKPSSGKVSLQRGARLAYLPQEPCALFGEESVLAEFSARGIPAEEAQRWSERLGLSRLSERNPLDLSGGERQRLALALLLSGQPDVLLLDEPTKGMDAAFKLFLAGLFGEIKQQTAVLLVTHDAEFAALCADRCALLFNGELVSTGAPAEFFPENYFYTTPLCRLAGGIATGWV